MGERKLVKSGLSSFTIALPKDWLVRNNLGKGGVIFCKEEGSRLVILPKKPEEKKPTDVLVLSIGSGVLMDAIIRDLVAGYLTNKGNILIKGELRDKLKEVRTAISQLPGLEVIEETGDRIIAKDFIDIDEIVIKGLIRRIDNIVRSMLIDTLDALKDVDEKSSEAIRLRDKEVNRLTYLVYKGLNYLANNPHETIDHGFKPENLMHVWELNNTIEKLGDELKRIATTDIKQKLSHLDFKKVKEIFEEMKEFYLNTLTALYTHDINLCDKYAHSRHETLAKIEKYISEKESVKCRRIMNRLRYCISHINDISRLVRYLEFK